MFLVDFMVIEMKEDKQTPLLFGRPFLAIGAALIDVKKGELTPTVGDEVVHFNLNHSLKQPELSSVNCEIAETKIPIKSELATACNFQNSMNENEMNSSILSIVKLKILTPILN